MLEDRFNEAIKRFNENRISLNSIAIDFRDNYERNTKQNILNAETAAKKFKNKLCQAGKQLSNDEEALRFIAVVTDDFMQFYYIIRGVAADIRDGKTEIHWKILYYAIDEFANVGQAYEFSKDIFSA